MGTRRTQRYVVTRRPTGDIAGALGFGIGVTLLILAAVWVAAVLAIAMIALLVCLAVAGICKAVVWFMQGNDVRRRDRNPE